MYCKSTTLSSSRHIRGWLLEFCRGKHAHSALLRPCLHTYRSHLLFLHRFCPYLQLAAHDYNIPFSSVSREKAERATQPYRLMRLRPRSTSPRDNPVHRPLLPFAYRRRLLPYFCIRADADYLVESVVGYMPGISESFPAFCVDVAR